MSAALSSFGTLAEFGTVAEYCTLLARWPIVELASSMNIPLTMSLKTLQKQVKIRVSRKPSSSLPIMPVWHIGRQT